MLQETKHHLQSIYFLSIRSFEDWHTTSTDKWNYGLDYFIVLLLVATDLLDSFRSRFLRRTILLLITITGLCYSSIWHPLILLPLQYESLNKGVSKTRFDTGWWQCCRRSYQQKFENSVWMTPAFCLLLRLTPKAFYFQLVWLQGTDVQILDFPTFWLVSLIFIPLLPFLNRSNCEKDPCLPGLNFNPTYRLHYQH